MVSGQGKCNLCKTKRNTRVLSMAKKEEKQEKRQKNDKIEARRPCQREEKSKVNRGTQESDFSVRENAPSKNRD
jgi:hypothetical protein